MRLDDLAAEAIGELIPPSQPSRSRDDWNQAARRQDGNDSTDPRIPIATLPFTFSCRIPRKCGITRELVLRVANATVTENTHPAYVHSGSGNLVCKSESCGWPPFSNGSATSLSANALGQKTILVV